MIKFFFAGRRSADTIVDVAAVKFRFGSITLVEKLIVDVTHDKSWRTWVPFWYS